MFVVDEPEPSLGLLQWCNKKANTLQKYKLNKNSNKRTKVCNIEWPSFKVCIPNATFSKQPSLEAYQLGCADTNVYFWDPAVFWHETCPIKCLYCGETKNIEVSWPKRKADGGCIPVYSIGKIDWLYCARYFHNGCTVPNPKKQVAGEPPKPPEKGRSWNTMNDAYLETLPTYILQQLPGASSTI